MTHPARDEYGDVSALRRRITELEDLLSAIEDHRVDAFVVGRQEGKRVFVLEGSDRTGLRLAGHVHAGERPRQGLRLDRSAALESSVGDTARERVG